MAKPLPWSYSALNKFTTCPYQYYETKVLKNFADAPGEAAIWGTYVHKQIEDLVVEGKTLPDNCQVYRDQVVNTIFEPIRPMNTLEETDIQIHAEVKLALNTKVEPADWSERWGGCIIDLLKIDHDVAACYDWKGLPLDTELPTPTGFVTMGDIEEGAEVFGSDGRVCVVRGKSQIRNRPCFKVQFDDKTSAVCDDEHLWKLLDGRVVPVTQLQSSDRIQLAAPLDLPYNMLPIDPYVLGLWIADGKHTSSEITKPGEFIWDEVQRRGYKIGLNHSRDNGKCRVHTVLGIRAALISVGLYGNKHIPAIYLRASYQQRLDLLRGLMDGDGNANPARKQAVFTTCDKPLSDQVAELLTTLGQRVNQAVTTQRGFGLTVTAYPLAFRPISINPFLLPRKADRIDPAWGPGNSHCRRVVSVTEVASVPTQCISVDSPDNTYLCTRWMIPTHNTGKVKPSTQLKLNALFVFYHYPQVNTVHTSFEWINKSVPEWRPNTRDTFTRDQMPIMWNSFIGDLKQYSQAFRTDTWQKRPSGLCKNWCPVTSCEHNGQYSGRNLKRI